MRYEIICGTDRLILRGSTRKVTGRGNRNKRYPRLSHFYAILVLKQRTW